MMRARILTAGYALFGFFGTAAAEPVIPKLNIGIEAANSPQDVSVSLQILLILTVLSLAPAMLIMLTSFTRIVIVLSFTRSALGTAQVPPNSVLIGLALFLTFFTMAPIFININDAALQPYLHREISFDEALDRASSPIRDFMFAQVREKDIALFVNLARIEQPNSESDVPMYVLIPAFLISELYKAFSIGFMIFIPFLVIDMVIAVTLMSMGMMMLPPVVISLPFKILLFVLVDGWHLIAQSLTMSFH
ncbi:MAG: flagellar type III secretion system pore protein FliP [Armatimonadetes bacterium]|nr:flagellar type III secretion system pore protein FliP [Armatimonadota bacterium]